MQYITKNFPSFITNKQQDVFFEINDIVKIAIKDKKYFKYKAKYQKNCTDVLVKLLLKCFIQIQKR